ncbi:MAG: T4 family baseplate hub assembly chaperone [Methylophagaceae bacterium]
MPEFDPTKFSSNIEQNPLRKYFRQPKVYITLPSKGVFYPADAINIPEGNEFPVFAMTAKDELTMKTPDALLNGAATVEIIKSCVPNILNPWKMPSIDLDAVLIAIRVATYGETMEITTKVPGTGEDRAFSVDLRQLLNKLVTNEYKTEVTVNDMNLKTRPLTYREFTDASLKTFEEQRIFALVNDEKISDTEKLERFNTSFQKLTNLTVKSLASSITSISFGDTEVTNQVHIQEFIENADKQFYQDVLKHIETQRDLFVLEPLKVTSSEEDIAAGAPKEYEVPITFDQSNFFG